MPTVVFVVPTQVHLLDLAGPAQVFSTASDAGAEYHLVYVCSQPVLDSHQGLQLQVDTSWPSLVPEDIVLVTGRRVGTAGAASAGLAERLMEGIRAHRRDGGRVGSVCSGAFTLAETGLLDDRRATTHHDLQEGLARRFPAVRVVRDVLYVVDGPVVTSAGIASGIDLALHLVAVDHGPALAVRVARTMVVSARRNGSAPQDSAMLRHRDHLSDVVHRVQDVIDARFSQALPLDVLACEVGVSERTLTRLFRATTGMTPLRYQQTLRLERAERLLDSGWTVESTARSVGFSDARMLRRLRAAQFVSA